MSSDVPGSPDRMCYIPCFILPSGRTVNGVPNLFIAGSEDLQDQYASGNIEPEPVNVQSQDMLELPNRMQILRHLGLC